MKHLDKHKAIGRVTEDHEMEEDADVLMMGVMFADKNEREPGGKAYTTVPLFAKCRIILQGPQDSLEVTEQQDGPSPVVPEDALVIIFAVSVILGLVVASGDTDTAFLNALNLERKLYLRAPRRDCHPCQE